MTGSCRACGRPSPGPVPADSIVAIAAPKDRAIPGDLHEEICLRCQWGAYDAMAFAAKRARLAESAR